MTGAAARRTRRLRAASLLLSAFAAAAVSAQDKPSVRVTLGFASAPPGRQVTVPLLVEGVDGKKVRRVESDVKFPSAHLSFMRLERAALLDDQQFEAVADVRAEAAGSVAAPGQDQGSAAQSGQLLEVRISSKHDGVWLQDGILAYLVFRIEPGTSAEKTPEVVLQHQARIFSGATEAMPPLAEVSERATLVVENPNLPVFACFFYMH